MSSSSRREKFEAMLAASPDDAELKYAIAMEYLSEGNEDTAIEKLTEIKQAHPEHVASYQQLGQIYQNREEDDLARTAYEEGIAVARKVGNEHAANEMTNFLAML